MRIAEEFLPSDPLFANQWHLRNIGQGGNSSGVDINVTRVWPEFTGSGIAVGVYDTGLEYTHHDLNYSAARHVIVDGVVHDPVPTSPNDYHGTAVAGLIGAKNNGVGTVGVAFNAQLTGVWIAGRPLPLSFFVQVMAQQDNFEVVNHSWGFTAPFAINGLDPFLAPFFAGIADGANNGRGGLGTIIMKAAGNDRTAFGNSGIARDANDESFTNSRYTNAVAAVGWDGQVSSYSSPGAALLISAPSTTVIAGTRVAGIWTTDRLGANGSSSPLSGVSPDADYTGIFGGTSAATPIASGVVALMLESNPDLGWRDVAQILAYSARYIGSPVGAAPAGNEAYAWSFNGAGNWNGGGLHFSNDYGFGLIDALAAVRLAESWQLQSTSANEASVASPLVLVAEEVPDNNAAGLTFTLDVTEAVSIEKVALQLNWALPHTFASDLRITLTAPEGTVSTLHNRTGGSSNLGDWVFSSNAFRGELSAGTWTVNVADLKALDSGFVSTAQLTVYGSSNTSDDLYVYTDEFSSYVGLFGHSATLTDSDGGTDAINAAAVTLASFIDLNAGATSTIDGTPLTLADGTTVEDAFGGDGDDTMIGNSCDNILVGNRGGDTVQGGDGDDTLRGGAGGDVLDGGAGIDAASYAGSKAGVTIDLATGAASGGDAAGDVFTGIEDLVGSSHADILIGDDGNNTLAGGAGGDVLDGGAGGDALDGGAGIDAARFARSNAGVTVDLATGATSGGDAAGDTLTGIENLIGSIHSDTLIGSAANNSIAGGAGDDMLAGGDGNDTLAGGVGGDALDGGGGVDAASYAGSTSRVNVNLATGSVWGGHATGDTLMGVENLIGSAYADTLIGNTKNNVLNGGLGSDRLAGWDGNDTLKGGADADSLEGGAGIDTVSYTGSMAGVTVDLAAGAAWGGDAAGDAFSGIENVIGSIHADVLTGDAGSNALNGGLGSDVLTGGAGCDIFVFKAAVELADVDHITDFAAADDTIRIENAIFTALTSTGMLSALAFAIGTTAVDPDDRIIYDSAGGALYYDADGAGGVEQVQFATLASRPIDLAHADFFVV
jgi:Ca2+-binding RTX toxin-like protein